MKFLDWFVGRNREVTKGNTPSAFSDLKILAEEMKIRAEHMFVMGRKPTAEDMRSYNDRIAIQCERQPLKWHVSVSSIQEDSAPMERDIDLIRSAFYPFARKEQVALKRGDRNEGVIHLYCSHSTETKPLQTEAEANRPDTGSKVFEKAGMKFVSGSCWLLLPSRFENRIFITITEPEKLGSLVWVVVRPIHQSAPLINLSFDSIEDAGNYLFIPDRKTAYACRSAGQLYECCVPDALSDEFPRCFDTAP
jgi:hypothetical protein